MEFLDKQKGEKAKKSGEREVEKGGPYKNMEQLGGGGTLQFFREGPFRDIGESL